ncbi:ATP-dependent DNA helicase [Paenibacillus gansuensis]|uniref:ATP-dependent DNA helicase n=1 Tax=Paenibacillus gansuensis TaxID=306542 RepID=A0ABW5PDZ2_9BACL
MERIYRINVRSLVEYVFRSGSIESGFRTGAALTEGTKAHQAIQMTYGDTQQKEVHLKAEAAYGNILYQLEGRCDGLFLEEGQVTIEEIKSFSEDLSGVSEEGRPVHWAQAQCYAYMYAREHQVQRVSIQLTYVHIRNGGQKRLLKHFTLKELERFVYSVLQSFHPYAELRMNHEERRNASMKKLKFPFPAYREGQRKLAGSVYQTIREGTGLLAKAPTGIGKTISTLFPAVKAVGEGLLQRIYYLTAKTITRTAAEEALLKLELAGLHMHSVTLTAKDKVCYQETPQCTKELCVYAEGYYDRINDAILDILEHETRMTREVIDAYARKHRVCPFEFSLDIAYAADAVICDYNYVFDPRVSLKRLLEEQKKKSALLIDEAHNLVDRAREMYSAQILKSSFLDLKRAYKDLDQAVAAAAKGVNDFFIQIRKESAGLEQRTLKEQPAELPVLLEQFAAAAEQALMLGKAIVDGEPLLLNTYYEVQGFIRISKLYDVRYVTLIETNKSEVSLKLFCLDPSELLKHAGKGFRSRIYFSATLFPMSFFREMLGAGEEDYSISIASPFSREQLDVRLLPLSTRYIDRDASVGPLVTLIKQILSERTGNGIVFFPSYEYMHSIYHALQESEDAKSVDTDILLQQQVMTEQDREAFLSSFQAQGERRVFAFAVMGGMFSEGIDLQGDRLTNVIIVGVGLPKLGVERNVMKDYFNKSGRNGYDYAYVYPGINKVLQAGGRLIRSEEDSGLLVLVDDRYLHTAYQRLLPEEWKHYQLLDVTTL